MNKKIVWIVNEYNGPGKPRTRQTILAQLLEESGYEPYVIASSTNNKFYEFNKKINHIDFDNAHFIVIKAPNYDSNIKRSISSYIFQKTLWKQRNNLPKPDVIVSDFAGYFGNIFLKWKKKYGTKVIYDILDLWPEGFVDMGFIKRKSLLAKVLYGQEYKSYRNADGIIFSFQGGKNYIVDQKWDLDSGGKVDVSDIGYLNNGVDLSFFRKNAEEVILNDEDLHSNSFKAIYLGSMSLFNGLEIIIEAAKLLKEQGHTDIKILMYGCGNREDALKNLANEYKLDNIIFKGRLDKNYAPYVLSHSNLNLFTFKDTHLLKYGVSPNKLFMYFASGKPVLSMIKPAYDLVSSRKCGLSVDNDPQTVADAIVRFAKMDKKEYDEYCRNAKQVAEEYDYKNLVKELIRFIEK